MKVQVLKQLKTKVRHEYGLHKSFLRKFWSKLANKLWEEGNNVGENGGFFSTFSLFLTSSLQVPNGFPSGSQCVPQGGFQ
jgi:hypothetical protein